MISGYSKLIGHIGYPTESFKAPMIYNPYFDHYGIDAAVIPLGCKAEDFAQFLPLAFRLSNLDGALITMPHKISVIDLLDEVSTTVKIAGSCNAVRRDNDGRLIGDMFDGEGFVRGILTKKREVVGRRVLVIGSGGVGSAIAASFAKAGVAHLGLYDVSQAMTEGLAGRLRQYYPAITLSTGSLAPEGYDIVVNATPLGMKEDDPLPLDVSRLSPETFVGEVVMKKEMTPFLLAARARGCAIQIGIDMLYEQIPAYLEFFGFRTTTAEELRALAQIKY